MTTSLLSANGTGRAPHQRNAATGDADAPAIACCWQKIAAADRTKPYALVPCCGGLTDLAIAVGDQTLLLGPIDTQAAQDSAVWLIAELAAERAQAAKAAAATPLQGDSQLMQQLRESVALVAASEASIVVLGENGTGKELVARQIHDQSARHAAPYVTVNCSAFNDNLLDAELFGHTRGAFTGAVADRAGLLEQAHGGTFFLDEVGDMSPALQVKLLRVLQEGTFYRVGSSEARHVDVRIIAATNRDLEALVARGEFREDLYYRLNVITVRVPPLRDRREDIAPLCQTFLARLAARTGQAKQLAPATLAALQAYRWPGNVRELENEIERLYVISADREDIEAIHLSQRLREATAAHRHGHGQGQGQGHVPLAVVPDHTNPALALPDLAGAAASGAAADTSMPKVIEATERYMIKTALTRHRGNKTRAAAELEISRRNLIRLVQKYDLDLWKKELA